MRKFLNSIFRKKSLIEWENPEFIQGAYEGLQIQTKTHQNTWGLGSEKSWNVDMTKGLLLFDFPDGKIVTTEIQVIGTYNPNDRTFFWGRDHPSVKVELSKHAKLAFEWGRKNNEPSFTNKKINCSLNDCWKIAGAVNRIVGGNGVYNGTYGSTNVFMTMGELEIKK